MKPTIKKADGNDTAIIIELLEKLYIELGEEKESLDFLSGELILKTLNSNITEIFIAAVDNKAIGLLTLTESQAIYAGGKYGVIDEMYVLPEHRSNNIGGLLVDNAKNIAKEKNWKRVDVTAPTEKRWKRTTAFYEKCGFVFTGPKLKLQM